MHTASLIGWHTAHRTGYIWLREVVCQNQLAPHNIIPCKQTPLVLPWTSQRAYERTSKANMGWYPLQVIQTASVKWVILAKLSTRKTNKLGFLEVSSQTGPTMGAFRPFPSHEPNSAKKLYKMFFFSSLDDDTNSLQQHVHTYIHTPACFSLIELT